MYRMMIADDEQIVLEGIKFMVETHFKDIEIAAMAKTGREAIEKSREGVFDIIFMDIKMPGINGIEAIEAIKKRDPDITVVILSAYEQFEYAKQAVELGVFEYILKPIHEEKLVDILNKIKTKINLERQQKQREIDNKEKLDKVLPILEHGFIYSLLMSSDYHDALYKYHDLFEMDKDLGFVMILEFGEKEEDSYKALDNKIGTSIKAQNYYEKVQALIKYKCKAIVGPMIVNRVTILVYESSRSHEYEQRLHALSLAQSLHQSIISELDTQVYMGIGACYPFEKIKNSLEEAQYALSRVDKEHFLHINDISELESSRMAYSYLDIKDDEHKIILLLENSQQVLLEEALKRFVQKVERKCQDATIELRNIILELMVMVIGCSYRNLLTEEEVGYSSYLGELQRQENSVALMNWCITKIMSISKIIQSKRSQHISTVVLTAKAYIDAHYNEDFSLNDVSKMVSVSPQYFSTIFKDEIGESFIEYIRGKRIEIAKDMLRQKQYSVKEICYEIGYNDPNYFSRLFKKMVGVSPTEFT
jgi:two-component system, response regulator YesN